MSSQWIKGTSSPKIDQSGGGDIKTLSGKGGGTTKPFLQSIKEQMEINAATKGLPEGPLDAPLAGASVHMKGASIYLQLHQHPTFMSLWSEKLEPWLIPTYKDSITAKNICIQFFKL